MRILPVLDILDGVVVRGVGGRRSEYQPLISRLTQSSEPLEVAAALRSAFGLHSFYLADLDAILFGRPNTDLYRQLIQQGFELLVDAGIRTSSDAAELRTTGISRLVVGLETCRSPQDLALICQEGTGVVFGLDLLRSVPQISKYADGWQTTPHEIAAQAVGAGVESILPLDLADVGMGTGGSTDSFCQQIRRDSPGTHLIVGGGVRDRDDLERLYKLGVDEVLVASALHDGRLSRDDMSL